MLLLKRLLLFLFYSLEYHGINGNISLDRRSEIVQSSNRYDMVLGSDKSLTRNNGTTYDVSEAERNNQQNIFNNNNIIPTSPTMFMNGTNGTLERNGELHMKKKWPTDKAYFFAKEILMTERTYKRDLDVINTVRIFYL